MRPTPVFLAVLAMLAACGGAEPVSREPQTAPVEGHAQPLLPVDLAKP